MKEIVDILISNNNTISTMESCTGGGVSNAITNIEGSSSIFKFGAVTYSNEYKIKMGHTKKCIYKSANKRANIKKKRHSQCANAVSFFIYLIRQDALS